jgi:hypothetical protein
VGSANSVSDRTLRPGDVVEVKSPAEILSTLEDGDALENMPFMPEMLRHMGQRYTVSRRVDKICDTVAATGSRRMESTVYLDDLRCDGSAHGGCQAGCKLYWKEDWLRRVDPDTDTANLAEERSPALEAVAKAGTRTVREGETEKAWRCQATQALRASEHLSVFKDPQQYWREFRNGNFGRLRFIFLMVRALVMEVAQRLGLLKSLPLHGPEPKSPPTEPLELQPGELVQVRSPAEIEATLDDQGLNRGLSFDREMLPYCGQTLRVKDRVERLIDETTGRMLRIPKDCIVLDGPVCSGECSIGRWFCPREIYPFWREAWLRRVEDPAHSAADAKHMAVPSGSANGSPR